MTAGSSSAGTAVIFLPAALASINSVTFSKIFVLVTGKIKFLARRGRLLRDFDLFFGRSNLWDLILGELS
jgi:hypothetical protein